MKQVIRLTESDLHRIVKESVNKILKESVFDNVSFNDRIVDKIVDDISSSGAQVNPNEFSVTNIMRRYACDEPVAREVRRRILNNSLFDVPMRKF